MQELEKQIIQNKMRTSFTFFTHKISLDGFHFDELNFLQHYPADDPGPLWAHYDVPEN
jgi:hypothetical protein